VSTKIEYSKDTFMNRAEFHHTYRYIMVGQEFIEIMFSLSMSSGNWVQLVSGNKSHLRNFLRIRESGLWLDWVTFHGVYGSECVGPNGSWSGLSRIIKFMPT
jgi:hypothetical protein